MARQVRTVMFLFLLLLATGFGPVAMAAMDPVQVLLVDDAHALFDGQSDTNVSDYVDRYRNALQQMENVEVDVTRTGDAAPGPAAKEMDQYDLVIWYTLGDYSGLTNKDECDNANDCVVFHPKGGSGGNTVGASGDVGNISQYLLQQNGRILITGHNVITNPPGSGFLNDVLGAAQYSKIYRNEDTSTDLGLGQVGHELVGELNDPVTRGTGFTLQLDTNIEPEDQRNFFLDACDEEDIGDDKYCDTVDSDDAFRWRDTNNNNFYTLESGHSNDDDSDADDYAHSLVRTNRTSRFDSQYKSVLMGVGFEALTPESKRHKLMNYTFHYLLGPRSRDTTVQDLEKGIIGEAGTFTQPSLSSSFQPVSFQHTYTKPVIVGTTNTLAGASTPHNLILEAQNVGGGSAQLRLCDSAGNSNAGSCTGPSNDQKGGYLVVDRAHTDEIEGIEAGTFNTSGDFDWQGSSITFDEEFESAPFVFATIQTT
ncbi:MAG: hypothetical protein SVU32_09060, partial [Candidatus Nanohaloarchaea archaeon]|nr:hypothetical protein [Candidatus Nanohaloarchaea archaeon]